MAALGKGCGVSMLTYKSLLLAFWLIACLGPLLLRGLPYTLRMFALLGGKAYLLGEDEKDIL